VWVPCRRGDGDRFRQRLKTRREGDLPSALNRIRDSLRAPCHSASPQHSVTAGVCAMDVLERCMCSGIPCGVTSRPLAKARTPSRSSFSAACRILTVGQLCLHCIGEYDRIVHEQVAVFRLTRIFQIHCRCAALSSNVSPPVPPALLDCRGTGVAESITPMSVTLPSLRRLILPVGYSLLCPAFLPLSRPAASNPTSSPSHVQHVQPQCSSKKPSTTTTRTSRRSGKGDSGRFFGRSRVSLT
jgi:hypothetical protein